MADTSMKETFSWSSRRGDFPIFNQSPHGESLVPLIYLDTAATAQKPRQVIEAISHFYGYQYGTVHRGVYALARTATEAYEAVRSKVQHFLHVSFPEEIIFTRGTTASLNLVARSLGQLFQAGDRILIPEIEHHSNIVPWQMLCQERGVVLETIPVNARGELILERYLELLDERVKLVSLAHVSNVLGTVHPVAAVIEYAHRVGALVCVDGAQAASHMPLDLQALDVDFYAFSGHKLYGPTGVGILYGKRALLEKLPPIEGGGEMIERVRFEKTSYAAPPLKFEAGTPMVAEVIGLGAALDYVQAIGLDKIQRHEEKLLLYALEHLSQIDGLHILGQGATKSAIISFTFSHLHPLDLALLLDCKGIAIRTGHQCSQPTMERFGLSHAARISFGLYNELEEIDTLCAVITSLIPKK